MLPPWVFGAAAAAKARLWHERTLLCAPLELHVTDVDGTGALDRALGVDERHAAVAAARRHAEQGDLAGRHVMQREPAGLVGDAAVVLEAHLRHRAPGVDQHPDAADRRRRALLDDASGDRHEGLELGVERLVLAVAEVDLDRLARAIALDRDAEVAPGQVA